jgi:hypothetical protein
VHGPQEVDERTEGIELSRQAWPQPRPNPAGLFYAENFALIRSGFASLT